MDNGSTVLLNKNYKMLFNHCIPKQNENIPIRYVVNYMYISYSWQCNVFLSMYVYFCRSWLFMDF